MHTTSPTRNTLTSEQSMNHETDVNEFDGPLSANDQGNSEQQPVWIYDAMQALLRNPDSLEIDKKRDHWVMTWYFDADLSLRIRARLYEEGFPAVLICEERRRGGDRYREVVRFDCSIDD